MIPVTGVLIVFSCQFSVVSFQLSVTPDRSNKAALSARRKPARVTEHRRGVCQQSGGALQWSAPEVDDKAGLSGESSEQGLKPNSMKCKA